MVLLTDLGIAERIVNKVSGKKRADERAIQGKLLPPTIRAYQAGHTTKLLDLTLEKTSSKLDFRAGANVFLVWV